MPDEPNSGFKNFSTKAADAPEPAAPAPEPEDKKPVEPETAAEETHVDAPEPGKPEPDKPKVTSPVPAVPVHVEGAMPPVAPVNDTAQGLVNNGMDVVTANAMTGPGSNT